MPLVPGPGQPFDALDYHAEGRGCRLCLSRFLRLVLLAGVIGLYPLVHASPPDPGWIPGFYHDADHDAGWWVIRTTLPMFSCDGLWE